VFGYNLDFTVVFSVGTRPSILLEPAHDAHAPAFAAIGSAGIRELTPAFNIEKRGFLFGFVILPVEAV